MKTVVAQGEITLNSLNDAFDISVMPNACIVKADYDGRNAVLDNAFSDISISQGSEKIAYTIRHIASSQDAVCFEIIEVDAYTKRIQLTSVPTDVLEGYVMFELSYKTNLSRHVSIPFTVVRESTMLDWIQEWNSNKTEIAGEYIVTPKLFAGQRNTEGELTGVYIGPNTTNGAGLYGYRDGEAVFALDDKGAEIGGWSIFNGGIQTNDGRLKILSTGCIASYNAQGGTIWGISSDGSAQFSAGNVRFGANGSAYFNGEIKAAAGLIGGWSIGEAVLASEYIMLNSLSNYIGISPYAIKDTDLANNKYSHKASVTTYGGVYLHYTSANSYGIEGYLPSVQVAGEEVKRRVFKIGEENHIASWNFDRDSLWMGNKLNQAHSFTNDPGDITIGSEGLRGCAWYIDTDGEAAFSDGLVSFGLESGQIAGWNFVDSKLYSQYATLVSSNGHSGLYLSNLTTLNVDIEALADTIHSDGGIYLRHIDGQSQLVGVDTEGDMLFQLLTSPTGSQIAGWFFDKDALYNGVKTNTGFTSKSGDITISKTGLRGFMWQLNTDGSGKLAGGNIDWTGTGHIDIGNGKLTYNPETNIMSLSGVTLDWGNIEGAPVIPQWVIDCEETKTQIGESYMVSPRIFSGIKNPDGKLTGIIQGKDCLKIDGEDRTGIYALVEDEVVFELDPVNQKYKFAGEIDAKSGKIGSLAIRDNKLIGIVDGIEKVEISVDEIPPLSSMFVSNVIPNSNFTSRGVMEYYVDPRNPSIAVDNTTYSCSTSFEVPYDSIVTIDYQNYFQVLTGTLAGECHHTLVIYKDGVAMSGNVLPAGRYRAVFYSYISGGYHASNFTAEIGVDIQGITYRIAPAKSAISANGVVSMHSSDNYFYYQKDFGMEVVRGKSGIRITDDGVEIKKNGVWSSL